EIDLEPAISMIAERAQALTGATGAAIALRKGNEIVCSARTGRTAPDLGVRLQTDSGISADCVRTGEVVLCNDADRNPCVDLSSCRRLGSTFHPRGSAVPFPTDARCVRSPLFGTARL